MHGTPSSAFRHLDRRGFIGIAGVSAAALLTSCAGDDEAATNPTSNDSAPMTVNYEARFAQFQPADEPEGDPDRVVWPDFVLASPPEIQELYAFHVTSGGLMRYMPCFCGCTGSGHRNNRDCYIREVHADGSITFDAMAPT